MSTAHSPSLIERIAEKLHLIPSLHEEPGVELPRLTEPGDLTNYPPPEQWDDWVEYEAKRWPRREARHYMIVPTICFNCEAGCGLSSCVDKETLQVSKFSLPSASASLYSWKLLLSCKAQAVGPVRHGSLQQAFC